MLLKNRGTLLSACVLWVGLSHAQSPQPPDAAKSAVRENGPCYVEFAYVDPNGVEVRSEIADVNTTGGTTGSLLRVGQVTVENDSKKARIRYPARVLIGKVIKVTFSKPSSYPLVVAVYQCHQRVSLRHGVAEGIGDLAFVTISGRLKGCTFGDGWWMRAFPAFEFAQEAKLIEGTIEADGRFTLGGPMDGERYAIVVGKGAKMIDVHGVDIVPGAKHPEILIDVSKRCPQ